MKLNYPIICTLLLGGFSLVNLAVIWRVKNERQDSVTQISSNVKPASPQKAVPDASPDSDQSGGQKSPRQERRAAPASPSVKKEATSGVRAGASVRPAGTETGPRGPEDRYSMAEVLDMRVVTDPKNPLLRTRFRLVRTDFKYPLVRVEDRLQLPKEGGEPRLMHQSAMVADHVLVKLNPGFTKTDLLTVIQPMGGRVRKELPASKVYLIELPDVSIDAVSLALQKLRAPALSSAEPDYLVHMTGVPNDTRFTELWGMDNSGQTGGVADADIDAPEAWNLSTGSRNVLVGVIDTGIDYTHPDLAPNMWTNPNEIAGNGIDDDGNGYVDDSHGWDFYNMDNDSMDDHSHGTHCAGTIGGAGNNATGVAGVCWNVSLVGLKFIAANGAGSTSDAAEAVAYATTIGVKITSNSWGGYEYSPILLQSIQDADAAGVLFVAAAGNEGANNDEATAHYPSSYDADNVIAVAATDHTDDLAYFSNYGVNHVDLAAPGVSILSSVPGGGYLKYSGTSMATPHVAGACALLKSYRPSLSHHALRDILIQSVDPKPNLASFCASGGRLNVFNALQFEELSVSPSAPFVATGPKGGPYSPAANTYTLTNYTATAQTWTAAKSAAWLDLSSPGGTLAPGASTTLTVSFNAHARELPLGVYEDTLNISNTSSGKAFPRSITLHAGRPDYFTEAYARTASYTSPDPHEYNFQRFVFTPNALSNGYTVYRTPVTEFNTDPTGGVIPNFAGWNTLSQGKQVKLYGVAYDRLFVNTDGIVTFRKHTAFIGATPTKLFRQPYVAGMWCQLFGDVFMKQLEDRVAITWQNQQLYGQQSAAEGTSDFQIELYFDGRIAITHLNIHLDYDLFMGLSRGQGVPIDFQMSDFRTYPVANEFRVELPAAASEGAGTLAGRGSITVGPPPASDLVVTLTSSGAAELSLPATVVIPAGQTTATFDVTILDDAVLDGSQAATATASAAGYLSGSGTMLVHDNESAPLVVNLPPTVAEGGAPVSGTVSVASAPVVDVTVALASNDVTEAAVPASITIPAGQTSASFNLTPVDDDLIDGTQTVQITASVNGWAAGSTSILVEDNEIRQLGLVLPTSATEGGAAISGKVTIPGALPSTITVTLQSSDTTEIILPPSVKLFAGETMASFPITVIDEGLIDGAQPVTLSATAPDLAGASGNITVEDNDPHHFTFSVISGPQIRNSAFTIAVTARNEDGSIATRFNQSVTLTGVAAGGAAGVTPAVLTGFVNGVWSGKIAVTTATPSVTLTVAENYGRAGTSNAFEVLAFGSHQSFSFQAVSLNQVKEAPFPVTITATDPAGNSIPGFTGTAAITGMTEVQQTIGTSTSTTHDLPFNTNYHEERSQIIYTAAELGGAKYITGLAFNVADVGDPALLTHLSIRLRHTTKSDFSGGNGIWESAEDLTTVFQGDQTLVQGWNQFAFMVPYRYEGTGNLLVDVSYDVDYGFNWATVYRTSAATSRAMYKGTLSNSAGSPLTWQGAAPAPTLSTRVPNIRLTTLSPVAVTPTNSGSFAAGSWTGSVTVAQESPALRLLASDGAGHEGLSQPFVVWPYAPVISTSPAALSMMVPQGATVSVPLTLNNSGLGVLNWTLQKNGDNALVMADASPSMLDLTQVRMELNASYQSVTSLNPDPFEFGGGETGNSLTIDDNVFINGNRLGTNVASPLPYSNDVIVSSSAFGTTGQYFTKKYPALFALAANVNGLNLFKITGDLGGYATDVGTSVISQTRGSTVYKGFIKRVYGSFVPSVNHLIILADNGSVSQTASTDITLDDHTVAPLTGVSRLYYLMFTRWQTDGGYVSDDVMAAMMSRFLDIVESPKEFVFSKASGTVSSGGSQTLTVTVNAANLPVGSHSRSLVVTSGHAAVPPFSVPVTIQVTAAGDTDGNTLPDAWETRYWSLGGSNPAHGPDGDADGDGVSNLLEYFLDSNPVNGDHAQMPSATTELNPADDKHYLTYRFRRRTGVTGIVYKVQLSDSLTSWASGSTETEEISSTPNPGGESETVLVRVKPALNTPGQPKKFVRLQVTGP